MDTRAHDATSRPLAASSVRRIHTTVPARTCRDASTATASIAPTRSRVSGERSLSRSSPSGRMTFISRSTNLPLKTSQRRGSTPFYLFACFLSIPHLHVLVPNPPVPSTPIVSRDLSHHCLAIPYALLRNSFVTERSAYVLLHSLRCQIQYSHETIKSNQQSDSQRGA